MTTSPTSSGGSRATLGTAKALVKAGHRDGTSWLLIASLLAGVASYVFLVIGGRALGTERFAPIATLWTVQNIYTAIVLLSIEQYEVRTVAAAGGRAEALDRARPALWGIVIVLPILITVFLLAAGDRAAITSPELAIIGGAWALTMALLVMGRGIAGGRSNYRTVAIATASDPVVRLALAVPVLVILTTTQSLAWTLAIAPLPFVAWWWWRGRHEPVVPTDTPPAEATAPGRFLVATSFANGSLQVLLAAGPLVLAALGATPAQVSAYFVTASLARAPLLVGVSFVPRILAPLTKRAELGQFDEVRGMAWIVAGATLVLAAIAGVAAYLLGPEVIALIYGRDFAISGVATGAAIAAVVAALGALGLNQVLIAEVRVGRLVPSWILGLVTAVVAILVLPTDPVTRMALASLAGQAIVVCALAVAIGSVRPGAGHEVSG